MSHEFSDCVSTTWLADHIGGPGLVVLDASHHLPAAKRDARAEFETAHLPGARFLDLAGLTDKTSSVPAALPNAAQLARRLAELGVRSGDRLVLYDDSALKTSARAWFALTAHGIGNLAILDGGLSKWKAEGHPLESGATDFEPILTASLPDVERVRSKADIMQTLDNHGEQIVDARAADRVFGTGIDPVHGGQNGRIPGALNVPFDTLFNPDGTYKSPDELRAIFEAAGIDWQGPVVTTCGSGITASVLLFAMHLAGKHNTALYDGSWVEWSADPDTPKVQGPA